MEFEYDPRKIATNLTKPGIDFLAAQRLWTDVDRVEVPARTEDEPRWVIVGQIDGKHYAAVVTYRGDKVRLISVRRSRREEVAIYEGRAV